MNAPGREALLLRPTMLPSSEIVGWLARIRAENREMPGLCLTEPQARRLWNLDAVTCARVLETLVGEQFLVRTDPDGYVLAHGRLRSARSTYRGGS